MFRFIVSLACLVLLAACVRGRGVRRARVVAAPAGASGWSLADARSAVKLETTVDASGRALESEYHIAPEQVPAAVRAAMDRLHPGGPFTGAEKEWNGGVLYYELTRAIGGYEVEAMFRPDGTLFSEEVQIPAADVPEAVRGAIASGWPAGQVKHFEAIKDGQRRTTEYHVKLDAGGRALKVIVAPDGGIRRVLREVPAEVEVPLLIAR